MDYTEISKLIQRKEQNGVIATIIKVEGTVSRKPGSKMIFWQDGDCDGSIGGGEFEKKIKDQATTFFLSNEKNKYIFFEEFDENCKVQKKIEVFLEKLQTKTKIYIYGAGHVGVAIAQSAHWLDFDIFLGDDRENIIDSLNKENVITAHFCPPNDFIKKIKSCNNKSLILATRTTDIDIEILEQLSKEEIKYIGILGSKKRWNHTKSILQEKNIPTQFLEQIHSPIGLSINAQTPKEIAISVMGQIIQKNNLI